MKADLDAAPMSYTEKIDVLDMIINILREHEEKLDELVTRAEEAVARLEAGDVRNHGHGPDSEAELSRRFYEGL